MPMGMPMPPGAMPPGAGVNMGGIPGPPGGAPGSPGGMEALMALAQHLSASPVTEFAQPLDQAIELLGLVSSQVRLRNPEVARELNNAQKSILNARLKLEKGPPKGGGVPNLGALPGMGMPTAPTGISPGGPPMPSF